MTDVEAKKDETPLSLSLSLKAQGKGMLMASDDVDTR